MAVTGFKDRDWYSGDFGQRCAWHIINDADRRSKHIKVSPATKFFKQKASKVKGHWRKILWFSNSTSRCWFSSEFSPTWGAFVSDILTTHHLPLQRCAFPSELCENSELVFRISSLFGYFAISMVDSGLEGIKRDPSTRFFLESIPSSHRHFSEYTQRVFGIFCSWCHCIFHLHTCLTWDVGLPFFSIEVARNYCQNGHAVPSSPII